MRLVCGQLLYVSYLDPSLQFKPGPVYSWHNLSSTGRYSGRVSGDHVVPTFCSGIRRIGYAKENLHPPRSDSTKNNKNKSSEYYKTSEKLGKERSWIFLTKDIDPTTSTAVGDSIKPGEFLSKLNILHFYNKFNDCIINLVMATGGYWIFYQISSFKL